MNWIKLWFLIFLADVKFNIFACSRVRSVVLAEFRLAITEFHSWKPVSTVAFLHKNWKVIMNICQSDRICQNKHFRKRSFNVIFILRGRDILVKSSGAHRSITCLIVLFCEWRKLTWPYLFIPKIIEYKFDMMLQ